MRLTLFDLDNTLLAGDSNLAWTQFLVGRGVLSREFHEARTREFYDQYLAGTLDIREFLAFQLQPLSRHPRARLDAWLASFMREKILPIITPAARELVERHIGDSDQVAIVTATNSFVTAPIAREFGVAHLIATEPEQVGGEFTGRVSGLPCFREDKVARLESWLAGRGLRWQDVTQSWFYSDSLNDLFLLQKVSHPVAVDPDSGLKAHAERQGWPVISLK